MEEAALAAMQAAKVLTIYRDAISGQAVLMHVHAPERFWASAQALLSLPDAPDPQRFFDASTSSGWGWAQCIYQEEDAGENPWMCRETFPSDPVGALYAREFTLVWRFPHSPALQAALMAKVQHFMIAMSKLTVHGGFDGLSLYLRHALPLGTEVTPYGTLLWYMRLEFLNANKRIHIVKRSKIGGRPLQWRLQCARILFVDAFPAFFFDKTPPGAEYAHPTTDWLRLPSGRVEYKPYTTNWLGLPFLRVDDAHGCCSVADLFNHTDDTFFKAGHLITHLPLLEASPTPRPQHSEAPLLDTEVFDKYNEKGQEKEGKKKRDASGGGGGASAKRSSHGGAVKQSKE